jgi:hypothetical protein
MSEPTTNGARCWRCGRGKDEASALEALSWVCDRSSGRPQWLCDRCARDQVRNIESKLPTEYW